MFPRHRLEMAQLHAKTSHNNNNGVTQTLNALQIANAWNSSDPILLRHPEAAEQAAQIFRDLFRGQTMFAVKANSCPGLLRILHNNGIRSFDVASIQEIRHVRKQFPQEHFPHSTINFMHPIKNQHAIREAFWQCNVTTFALDSSNELEKILTATGQKHAKRKVLTLFVRMDVTAKSCKLALDAKYGVKGLKGQKLLQEARHAGYKLGICFHVGSQTMDPADIVQALNEAHAMAQQAGVVVDKVSVGGGFATRYPGMDPPPLPTYFDSIHDAVESLPLFRAAELWSEPGRALCAEYNSLILHVEEKRDNNLYVNESKYHNLSDAGNLGWPLTTTLLRDPPSAEPLQPYSFYGCTLDSADKIAGPIMLPGDVVAGDYIWIKNTGAYGTALSTRFCLGSGFRGVAQTDRPIGVEM